MNAVKAQGREAGGAAEELLGAAERLFASAGVENVALTQIVAQSRQRNRSALHYHFGSRDGVLSAVMTRRLVAINARRETLLDQLGERPTVADILRATVAPLAMAVVEEPWGADYLSILAQVTFHPRLLGGQAVDEALLSGIRRCRRLLATALPQAVDSLMAQRLTWFTDSVVFALARWVRDTPAAVRTPAAMAALVENLVAYGAGGLAVPHFQAGEGVAGASDPQEPRP